MCLIFELNLKKHTAVTKQHHVLFYSIQLFYLLQKYLNWLLIPELVVYSKVYILYLFYIVFYLF